MDGSCHVIIYLQKQLHYSAYPKTQQLQRKMPDPFLEDWCSNTGMRIDPACLLLPVHKRWPTFSQGLKTNYSRIKCCLTQRTCCWISSVSYNICWKCLCFKQLHYYIFLMSEYVLNSSQHCVKHNRLLSDLQRQQWLQKNYSVSRGWKKNLLVRRRPAENRPHLLPQLREPMGISTTRGSCTLSTC